MYRIKEITNKVSGETKFKLQVKVLFWWNNCHKELGWGCSEEIVTNTYAECEDYKLARENEDGW